MATPPFKSVFKGITAVLLLAGAGLLAACGGNNSSSVDNLSISMTDPSLIKLNYSFSEQKNPASPSGYDPEVSATTEMVTFYYFGISYGTYRSRVIHARSGYSSGGWAQEITIAFSSDTPGYYSIGPTYCNVTIKAPGRDLSDKISGQCSININKIGKVGDEINGNSTTIGMSILPSIYDSVSLLTFNINNLNFSVMQNP
ncbi:MAG: hypothetical protein OEW12_05615 [Deltaproteobacteria bacterium]|nr:hypothetical protein [Deltaproteobacteria bacterium]